jgi:hypothetical protein
MKYLLSTGKYGGDEMRRGEALLRSPHPFLYSMLLDRYLKVLSGQIGSA